MKLDLNITGILKLVLVESFCFTETTTEFHEFLLEHQKNLVRHSISKIRPVTYLLISMV